MNTERLLQRPIMGGVFGEGRYALASMPCVAHGLHAVRYLVVEPRAGTVIATSEDKVEALAGARRVLRAANDARTEPAHEPRQLELGLSEPEEQRPPMPMAEPPPRKVSRRRQEIFTKSERKCHYCGCDLQLEGPWHVEHMMPRALGGGDDFLNLVAACVRCNLAKGPLTSIEFVAASHARIP